MEKENSRISCKTIAFSKVKTNNRWRYSLSLFGLILTVSNTPIRFQSMQSVNRQWDRTNRLKKALLQERGNNCELCGRSFAEEKCELHHIKKQSEYPELKYDKGNVMLVCRTCHVGIHQAEERPIKEDKG